jgi:hypothetical protein
MWPFQKAKREQLCLIVCEDRKIDEAPLPIEKGYMVDDKTSEAWHLCHALLLPYQGTRRLVSLISERDAVPLSPFGGLSEEERQRFSNVNQIAREELYRTLQQLDEDQKKNKIASAIKFTVLIVAVMFALVTLVSLVQGGSCSIPGM